MKTGTSFAAFASALLGLAGCVSPSIVPAPAARTLPGTAAVAVNRVGDVVVTVQVDAWRGDVGVATSVQPVRVTITNGGASPIRVRYGDFTIVTPNGRRLAALPPFRVEGAAPAPALGAGYAPIARPAFTWSRFFVAPYYAPLYSSIPVWGRPYAFYDAAYHGAHHRELVRRIRPTPEMLSVALPEGMLEAGGQLSGFLYFQKVDPAQQEMTFHAIVVAVEGGAGAPAGKLGEISIPFAVRPRA